MSQNETSISASQNPLSELARKERALLLGASFVGLMIAQLHILPTKIAVIGIDFNAGDQRTFGLVMTGLLVYALIAFALYAASDYVRFKRAYYTHLGEDLLEHMRKSLEVEKLHDPADLGSKQNELATFFDEILKRERNLGKVENPLGKIRLFMELVFPVVLGLFTIGNLLFLIATA